jgi:hypothetical protein
MSIFQGDWDVMTFFSRNTDCFSQQAQLGYNYLKYDNGWPTVLDGIVIIKSSAASISRLPGWWSLMILSGMWTLIAVRVSFAIANYPC